MKFLILFFSLAHLGVCYGQLPDYYVYLVKGTVTVSGANKKPQKIKQGDFVFATDVLDIGKNAEVTLTNREAAYFVLSNEGSVKVSTIPKNLSKSYTGVTKKYLHLVWEEVLDPNYDFTKFKQKNLTGVYGGVSRGENCENLLFPINGLKTSEDSINFKWLKTSSAGRYNFLIYDGAGKEILSKQASDTQTIISLHNLQPGKYYWLIKSDDATCEDEVPLYFEILSREQEKKLTDALIPQTPVDNLTAELELIDKLEKNAFIYAAKARYADLLKNNSGNEALLKMYVMFLLSYSFNEEAALAWNEAKK